MAGCRLSGCELAEGAVRPGGVVVPQVFGQHPAQVVLIDGQQPVEELAAQGADDPFADGVRPGRLRWQARRPSDVPSRAGDGQGGGARIGCSGIQLDFMGPDPKLASR